MTQHHYTDWDSLQAIFFRCNDFKSPFSPFGLLSDYSDKAMGKNLLLIIFINMISDQHLFNAVKKINKKVRIHYLKTLYLKKIAFADTKSSLAERLGWLFIFLASVSYAAINLQQATEGEFYICQTNYCI